MNREEKQIKDMEMLTHIYKKCENNPNCDLSDYEIRFLYEIDNDIEKTNEKNDSIIEEIKSKRNLIRDLNKILKDVKRINNLHLFDELTSAEGLVFPEKFYGSLYLNGLEVADGLRLPKEMEDLYLKGLKTIDGLELPNKVRWLNLNGLEDARGLILPKQTYAVCLGSLASAEGLVIPEYFEGGLYLTGLTSTEKLVLPKYFNNLLKLFKVMNIRGLCLPCNFDLKNLEFWDWEDDIERRDFEEAMLKEIRMNPEKYFYTNEDTNDKQKVRTMGTIK